MENIEDIRFKRNMRIFSYSMFVLSLLMHFFGISFISNISWALWFITADWTWLGNIIDNLRRNWEESAPKV